ncbi:hypothetical protein [Mycobacterium mantenii]|nr:hypothetical protein [Mycobacterium mantenii]
MMAADSLGEQFRDISSTFIRTPGVRGAPQLAARFVNHITPGR